MAGGSLLDPTGALRERWNTGPLSLDPIERRTAIEMRIDEYAHHSPFTREEVGKRLTILRSPSGRLISFDLDDVPGVQYASAEVDAPVGGRFSHPIPRASDELRHPAMLLRPIDVRICTDLGFIEVIGETADDPMEGYF